MNHTHVQHKQRRFQLLQITSIPCFPPAIFPDIFPLRSSQTLIPFGTHPVPNGRFVACIWLYPPPPIPGPASIMKSHGPFRFPEEIIFLLILQNHGRPWPANDQWGVVHLKPLASTPEEGPTQSLISRSTALQQAGKQAAQTIAARA